MNIVARKGHYKGLDGDKYNKNTCCSSYAESKIRHKQGGTTGHLRFIGKFRIKKRSKGITGEGEGEKDTYQNQQGIVES